MALALPLLLALLGTTPGAPGRVLTVFTGLGAPGGGCGVPPSAWCQDWVTALRCGALGRCPHLTQRPSGVDACAVCQYFMDCLRKISNETALEEPRQVCVNLQLCPAEPGAALALPVLELPGGHRQGPGLSPQALPLPLPLCWLCRSLVARAEAAVPVGSVAAAVAGLCRALPLPVAGACQCLAERYAALALEGLLGRLGPRLLCRLFLACRSGDSGDSGDSQLAGTLPPPWLLETIVVRLADCVREEDPKGAAVPALSLSLGPCALGPIFWCSGPEAARRCQVSGDTGDTGDTGGWHPLRPPLTPGPPAGPAALPGARLAVGGHQDPPAFPNKAWMQLCLSLWGCRGSRGAGREAAETTNPQNPQKKRGENELQK
ncbi:pulmonary surfactant-associated protein B [Passer domesticus]|uniref:pulmonary surfactant-associated protein B n=1 Tax=Passer domesticus TaxID=48849 RepID=UPI0030FF0DBA